MSKERIGIVGNGGREFALGQALATSDEISEIHFFNGNAGTDNIDPGRVITHNSIKPASLAEIVALAQDENLFTVIGPEAPLIAGLADQLRHKGLLAFGPSAEAAQLEASKSFTYDLARDAGIPIPETFTARTRGQAYDYMKPLNSPRSYVIKADGLASGKGVELPDTYKQAYQTVGDMLSGRRFGEAGKVINFQERIHGPEVSVITISDGKKVVHLPLSQDHKRLRDGDEGPNTGGMGAYAPLPEAVVGSWQAQKMREYNERAIAEMARRGTPFAGVLYGGYMLAEEYDDEPLLLEFNVRFGDPETQALMALLVDAGVDVHDLLRSAAEGNLKDISIPDLGRFAVTTCIAAEGYPDSPRTGDEVFGLDKSYSNANIQQAGTALSKDGRIVTAGGRVAYSTAIGNTAKEAAEASRGAIGPDGVHFDDMQYRSDIAHQAIAAEQAA